MISINFLVQSFTLTYRIIGDTIFISLCTANPVVKKKIINSFCQESARLQTLYEVIAMASLVTLNQIAAPGFEKLQIIMRVDFMLTLLNVQTKITWSMKSLTLTKIMNQYPTNLDED